MDHFGTMSTGCFLFAEAKSRKVSYSRQKVSMGLNVGHSDIMSMGGYVETRSYAMVDRSDSFALL